MTATLQMITTCFFELSCVPSLNRRQVPAGGVWREFSARPFEVRLSGPLDVPASVELFRRSGDDLLDRWDGITLVRTLPVGTGSVAYACTVSGTREEPALQVVLEDTRWKLQIGQAPAAFAVLLQADPVSAHLECTYRGMRPSEREVREVTTHWGTSAGIAQVLLLRGWSRGAAST